MINRGENTLLCPELGDSSLLNGKYSRQFSKDLIVPVKKCCWTIYWTNIHMFTAPVLHESCFLKLLHFWDSFGPFIPLTINVSKGKILVITNCVDLSWQLGQSSSVW